MGERTRVRLEATVEQASPLDRVLLAAGGRRWLERRFAAILQTLERRVREDCRSVRLGVAPAAHDALELGDKVSSSLSVLRGEARPTSRLA